jgi:hypothetical protein
MVETDHGKLAIARRLRSSVTAVVETSGGAPTLRVASAAMAQAGPPPASVELAWEILARRIGHYL